ncbi:hypothetical protein JW851_02925 [Candidatus Woesearchaeota archaeon]|nr:hypothetical protein [Candidatus Woesearchaeota archaeon]
MTNHAGLMELWKHVEKINSTNFPKNNLKPIMGNGKIDNPKIMFVFINPTIRNISSNPSWKSFRAPFIGTKQVWRIFHKAGLFDSELIYRINNSAVWSVGFAETVYKFLEKKGFYFTNIVKWTGQDAALPDSQKIGLFLPILEKEIELVNPKYIVAFGLIPFKHLTKKDIKLSDYFLKVKKNNRLDSFDVQIGSKTRKIIPCYFPVGRGNPKKAVEILKLVNQLK